MTTCKHCGAELPENAEICPNCGQQNTDTTEEFDLDSLLASLTTDSDAIEPDDELESYNIFDEFSDDDAISQMISEELNFSSPAAEEEKPQEEPSVFEDVSDPLEEPAKEADEELDIESLFGGEAVIEDVGDEGAAAKEETPEEIVTEEPAGPAIEEPEEIDALASIFDGFAFDEPEIEELPPETEEIKSGTIDPFSLDSGFTEGLDAQDMAVLDDLFQEIDKTETVGETDEDNSLLHLLDENPEEDESAGKGKKKKKKKKDDRTLLVKLFGNVPLDPSKIKHEPTPEEIAEKKQAKEEKKKKDAEEKKQAAEEKKAAAQAAKEEKAKLAEIAKEEKKARKMEQAKLILEEMKDTRINRVGAAIVFLVFALLALGIIVGSNLITYNIAINNAEKSFAMARGNDPKYYNDAYNQIYGLESKLEKEDIEFYDKVMTVMFVNKQLNSYNSYVAMGDEASALDSLLKGLKRYEKYSMYSILMGYDDLQYDLDYVRSQILAELDSRYSISMDEAMELIKEQSSTEYAKAVYNIVNRFYGQID